MTDYEKHLISINATILDALTKINCLGEDKTLFVCDDSKSICGSLTDGDIRRGLINGFKTSDIIENIISKKFYFLDFNKIDLQKLNLVRKQGVKIVPVLDSNRKLIKIFNLRKRKSILPLEAVIMAGGKGERLRPLTEKTPKPMVKLGEKPIIEHNIDHLIQYGIEKIYISIKYLGEQIKDYFGDGSSKGISIEYIEEEKYLGTGGAIKLVKGFETEYILVMNSDLFTDVNFEDLYLNTLTSKADIGISSIPYTVNIPYAIFERDGDRVLSFKEKPNNTHYANAGIYILKSELIKRIPKNEYYNITDLIQNVLDQGGKVMQNPIYGYWIDIGTHEDYNKAKEIIQHIPNGD